MPERAPVIVSLPWQQQWLVAALRHSALPELDEGRVPELIGVARSEGVLLLAESQLQSHPQRASVNSAVLHELEQAAHADMLEQLAMLAEQAKVFRALSEAEFPFLVMKGGALAHWLYAQPALRVVTDLDILIPGKAHLPALQSVLTAIGYAAVPGNSMAIETSFEKPGGPYGRFVVDAHWQLFNSMQLRNLFNYAELQAQAMELPGHAGVFGLSPVHALFNACGHRAIGLPHTGVQGLQAANALRWLWDVHALTQCLTEQQWQHVLTLAAEKQLSALMHEALSTVQQHFASHLPEALLSNLLQQSALEAHQLRSFTHWRRYQWQEFMASAPHWPGRLRWLWHTLSLDSPSTQARYGHQGGRFGRYARRLLAALKRVVQ